MPLIVKDRVQETSVTTGTGTLTLGGAVSGFQTFSSAIGDTNTTYYTIVNGAEWEVGIGTVGSGTLTRDTILESSNGGTAVNFSSGTKLVFCTYPAEKSVDIDTAQTLTNKTISGSSNTLSNIGNSSLTNSSITINGTPVSLGGSTSVGTVTSVAATAGTGISISGSPITSSGTLTITNTAPDQTVTLTQGGATTITGTYPNFTISSVDTTYSAATSTVAGLIELNSDTVQSVAANAVTSTANRTYGLQVNAAGQGVINVPWTDTVYTLPAATSTTLGGIELGSDTVQTVAANAVSSTASRTYALQVNSSGQAVVNVPWTDTNSGGTVTSVAALTIGTTGTDLSSTVANSTTTPVITLNVPTASATNRGVLSSADWTTFNNKGNGTVTSVSAGNGMSFTTITGTGSVTMGTPSSVSNTSTNSVSSGTHTHALSGELVETTSGSPLYYGARAWVNFNGTGTVAIRNDVNVSSITDNGTGDYTINFTTSMPDTNYAVSLAAGSTTLGAGNNAYTYTVQTYNTGSVRTQSLISSSTAAADVINANVVIFR